MPRKKPLVATKTAHYVVLEQRRKNPAGKIKLEEVGRLGPFPTYQDAHLQRRALVPTVPRAVKVSVTTNGTMHVPTKLQAARQNPEIPQDFVHAVEVARQTVQPTVQALMKRAIAAAKASGITGTRELAAIAEKASGQKPTPAQLQRLLVGLG